MHCFNGLQNTTAIQVIKRCVNTALRKDQATQMGIDMFEEERKVFRRKIEFLNEQVNVLTCTSNQLTDQNKKIMRDKAQQSR